MPLLPPHIARSVGVPADYAAANEVAKIQKALFPPFKERGFVLRGRCFNRLRPDGLVQVVHFLTMPATSSLYGQFTIDIGVYVPEVWAFNHGVHGAKTPKTFGAQDCDLRDSVVPPEAAEGWEALAHLDLIARAGAKMLAAALVFFDRFHDRDRIMIDLSAPGSALHGHQPAAILIAIIEWNRGQSDAACHRLETYLTKIAGSHPAHETYVRHLITRLATETPPN